MPPPTPSQAGHPAPGPSAERQAADSLLFASLLAAAGGSLDAFLYLQHGKVFAGAMTGNAVLCGVALLSHDRSEAVRHASPIAAFICGILLAEWLQDRLKPHAIRIGLSCEIVGLFAASFLPPSFPDVIFVPMIALLAAYQIAGFRKADQYSYNSTFITGDLRTAIVGLYRSINPATRAEGLRQARDLGLIVACFLAGATAGAVLAPRMGNHALWAPVLVLCIVLGIAIRRSFSTSKPGVA